jgi:hypothetical protein
MDGFVKTCHVISGSNYKEFEAEVTRFLARHHVHAIKYQALETMNGVELFAFITWWRKLNDCSRT